MQQQKIAKNAIKNEEKGSPDLLRLKKYRVRIEQIQELKISSALELDLEAFWKAIAHLCF